MDPERVIHWSEPEIGLEAVLVIDSTHLGPAAGGVRTRAYPDAQAALADARRLARAMSIKCAIAGLDAGGGKLVVRETPGMNRPMVFQRIGELVEDLGGSFRTAGDLGTTAEDLQQLASRCQFVHTDESGLCDSVGRGLAACMQALVEAKGRDFAGLRVAVQGAGAIGHAVCQHLHRRGARLSLSDLDSGKAQLIADEVEATVLPVADILRSDVDVVSPCAIGGVIDSQTAQTLQAWGLCGAANNIVTDQASQEALMDRNILVVPDEIASAGAVIDGIGQTVMGLACRGALIDALGATTAKVLRQAQESSMTTHAVALKLAHQRLRA